MSLDRFFPSAVEFHSRCDFKGADVVASVKNAEAGEAHVPCSLQTGSKAALIS